MGWLACRVDEGNDMKKRAGLLATASLLLATGCVSTGPTDVTDPLDIPTQWSSLSDELSGNVRPLTNDWIQDLGDPDATRLIEEALANNNNLAASAARVRAVRERVGVTRAGLLPSLNASLGATRNRAPDTSVGGDPSDGVYSNSTSLGATLSWEIDVWTRLTDQTRAAYIDAHASALDLASARLSLAGGTAQAYYALTESRLQRQLSERDVQTGEANLRIIERRYNMGISSSLDVRLARSSLSSSRATLIARQQAEKEASRRLEVLLGRYPSADAMSADALPVLAPLFDEADAYAGLGSPESLLFRRPDVLASERRLKSSGLRVSAARKAFLPSLSLTGNATEGGTGASDILDVDRVVASLAGSLVQPIFNGGRLRAQALAAKADMEAALYDYASTVLSAYEEVENAIAAERFLTARAEAQRVAFEEAVATEDLTTRQYVNGTTNIFNLINAQQRRISAESQYISAARAQLSNRIDLYLALGAPFATNDRIASDASTSTSQLADTTDLKGDRL